MRGCIDPGITVFAPGVGVGDLWKDFSSGDGKLSGTSATGPRRRSEGQSLERAGSMSQQSADGCGFPTEGGIDQVGHCFRPRGVGFKDGWKHF